MASKATQEYRDSFITLISQLSKVEQKVQELLNKAEKLVWDRNDAMEIQGKANSSNFYSNES
ncbi:hypothetical protein EC973_005486 [Apophysomyces ossiformis]|uniref:Uncharacterized protein n=1 Tax=Apophysomyces ossiformis TaxID=679940 RepID=A0A8H7ERK6_9FUNG|nr:hypothetical protein EC973_005486 [Apophysomyces ossiformis]